MTLPEMLIGLTLGLFISAALLTMWLQLQSATLKALEYARLNRDLQTIGAFMVSDIRRAGYRAWSPDSGLALTANPFMSAANAISIDRAADNETENSCLIYSYDLNQDGQAGGIVNERFGFRLVDQAIEMRIGGTDFNCRQGSWQKITRPGTVIDTLQFTSIRKPLYPTTGCTAGHACITRQHITIRFSGHLDAQPTQSITIQQSVTVANDRIS